MTQDEYLKVAESFDKAEESVTPFPVPSDDEIVVVGDANDTQVVTHDYKIKFRIPQRGEDNNVKYILREIEYNDVFITPRQDPKVQAILLELLPYFRKANGDGTVGKYTEAESFELVKEFSSEIEEHIYSLVAEILGVSPALKNFMAYDSVMDAMANIIRDYASIMNEGLAFFPQSSVAPTITTDQ